MSLEVTLTFRPHGDAKLITQLMELTIWNDLTGDLERGNYAYKATMADGRELRGTLKRFRRSQRDGAARLVARVMKDLFPVELEMRYSTEVRDEDPSTPNDPPSALRHAQCSASGS